MCDHHRLFRLAPVVLLILHIEAANGLPTDSTHSTLPQRKPIFRFTIYKRENITNIPKILKQHKPLNIPLEVFEMFKLFNRSKQKSISTLTEEAYKQKEDNENSGLKLNIDEEELIQTFKADHNTDDQSTTDDMDYTTEDIGNYTGIQELDDRFGGGVMVNHVLASLLGPG